MDPTEGLIICFNIRKMPDIFHYSENLNLFDTILYLDFSKAFDSLEWNFLYD